MEFDIERSLKNFGDNILVFGNDLAVKVSYRNFDMKRGRNCVKYSKEFQAGSTDSRRYLFLIGALFLPPSTSRKKQTPGRLHCLMLENFYFVVESDDSMLFYLCFL